MPLPWHDLASKEKFEMFLHVWTEFGVTVCEGPRVHNADIGRGVGRELKLLKWCVVDGRVPSMR